MKKTTSFKQNRINSRYRILLLLLMVGSGFLVNAQRMYPDMTVTVPSGVSDYVITFNYSGAGVAACDGLNYQFDIFKGGASDANIVLTIPGMDNMTTGTVSYGAGPGNSGWWGLRYREGESCTGCCLKWVWSGFPPAQSETDRDQKLAANNYSLFAYATTVAIKSPTNITASSEEYYDKIILNWAKGTDIPDELVQYRIYKGTSLTNGALVHTAAGTDRSWTDTTVEPNQQFYYWVTTYTSAWNGHESPRTGTNAVLGKARKLIINASDGLYTNRVKLEWEDLSSFAEEIRLERSIPNSTKTEELVILSKNARAYNDDNAIPGFKYTYYVTPINPNRTFNYISDTGYKKPDGMIKGNVTSVLGSGVSGVTVTAIPITTGLTAGAVAAPAGGYTATTDNDGYFEIRDIYYFDAAEFNIVPSKKSAAGDHVFKPASITRKLDLNARLSSGANFTDESVFTLTGKITFPASTGGAACGVPDVDILFNGKSRGIISKADGTWSYALQEEGTYTITPAFKHHTFVNSAGKASTTITVNGDVSGIDFTDTQTDSIQIRVQGGCGNSLGKYVKIAVTSTSSGNCFSQTYKTDSLGFLTLKDLPAREYSIKVTEIYPVNSNILDQIGNKPIIIDLTVRDTTEIITEREEVKITPADTIKLPNGEKYITPADTTITTVKDSTRSDVVPKVEFIYHSPIKVTVDFADAGAEVLKCNNNQTILMEQSLSYLVTFEVNEQLGGCPVNEGKLQIFDYVGDRGYEPVEIPISNGIATYTMTAGLPDLAESETHNHEKLLYVIPKVGFLESDPLEYWIAVTGVLTQAPSFITRSAELPMLILHDPPGDNSYAFVEKGTQIRNFETHEILVGGEAGAFANLMIGAKVLTPFSNNALGTMINIKAVAGRDNFNRTGMETTITFNENFSTSSLETLTGNDGDVYIGAALNQEFAIGDELSYDKDSCKFNTKMVPTINVTGFATTFVYTEKHIKYTLLPKLAELKAALINGRSAGELSEEEKVQANQLTFDIAHWENVLAQNAVYRDSKAKFKENKSFSAGAPYGNTYTSSSNSSVSYEYNAFINLDLDIGIKVINEAGAWYDSSLGITSKFRWGSRNNQGRDSTSTRTVGYIFDDNDPGDFFSVDILEDTTYNVPAFRLKLATTSCPFEPGSQPRDEAQIEILPPQVNNVPIGGQAVFVANLINKSQSRETREYGVRVLSTTNPDGAIIKIGGHQINNNGAEFSLDFNQTTSVVLTVEKGPYASGYEKIGILMYPICEYDFWGQDPNMPGASVAWISANFESECSNVALHLPGDGWLVNQNNNDKLNVAFTGYDKNNERLESITLQYKRDGQGWVDAATITKDSLIQNFYDLTFDVSGLPDGRYKLRAMAWCGIEGGSSYSTEQAGIIDRSSLAPFGTPSPADGFLRYGQEISVAFDKDINCVFAGYDKSSPAPVFKLYLEDGTVIPSTVQCSGSKIIITPVNDLFKQPLLEGVRVYAVVENIQDISGNVQKYKTEWSFLVNVSPVAWNPDNMHITAVETEEVMFNAILGNNASIDKPFNISAWPDWLTPSVTSASVLSGNTFTINLLVDQGLKPGYYEGEVMAMIDGVAETLKVSLELYSKAINWEVNHSNFEFNMNVVAQFSKDAGDLNLSTGLRDKIAAYVNGELRGVGNIQYVQELDRYAAFINVVSNKSGENGSLLRGTAFSTSLSAQQISVTDNGVSTTACRFKKANWIDYNVIASKPGLFTMEFRLASILTGKTVNIFVDGISKGTITVPNTQSLNTFNTISTNINIGEGPHVLRIQSVDAEFDLIWVNFPEYHVRNQNSTEVIDFRMWDGLNGIEYGAVEKLTFFSDGVVGSVEKPFILHPAGGIQEMVLGKGWTWISVNKENNNMSVGNIFNSITDPQSLNEITLKSQTAYAQYNKTTGWLGTLTKVDLLSGYLIYLSTHPDTLSLIGNTPQANVSLTLSPKWNWIGYPKQGVMETNDVLSQLTSNPGDIVKSQFEYAEYNGNTRSWVGDLKFFQPGRGYKLFVASPAILTYLKSASVEDLSIKHEYNMTLTAVVEFGVLPASDDYELRTYINGQLRGESPLTFIDGLGKTMAFNMIYGDRTDVGEVVHTVLWDKFNQKEIGLSSEPLLFGIDKIAGTIINPVVFNALNVDVPTIDGNNFRFDVYPNPFPERARISYSLPEDTHVLIRITDAFGREITRIADENQYAGNYEFTFEAYDLAPGMYFATIIAGDKIQTKKLILQK